MKEKIKSLEQNRCRLSTVVISKFKLMRRYVDFFLERDLKSLPVWECQFESGRGHHLSLELSGNILIIEKYIKK